MTTILAVSRAGIVPKVHVGQTIPGKAVSC
jgi:hypothetical protein